MGRSTGRNTEKLKPRRKMKQTPIMKMCRLKFRQILSKLMGRPFPTTPPEKPVRRKRRRNSVVEGFGDLKISSPIDTDRTLNNRDASAPQRSRAVLRRNSVVEGFGDLKISSPIDTDRTLNNRDASAPQRSRAVLRRNSVVEGFGDLKISSPIDTDRTLNNRDASAPQRSRAVLGRTYVGVGILKMGSRQPLRPFAKQSLFSSSAHLSSFTPAAPPPHTQAEMLRNSAVQGLLNLSNSSRPSVARRSLDFPPASSPQRPHDTLRVFATDGLLKSVTLKQPQVAKTSLNITPASAAPCTRAKSLRDSAIQGLLSLRNSSQPSVARHSFEKAGIKTSASPPHTSQAEVLRNIAAQGLLDLSNSWQPSVARHSFSPPHSSKAEVLRDYAVQGLLDLSNSSQPSASRRSVNFTPASPPHSIHDELRRNSAVEGLLRMSTQPPVNESWPEFRGTLTPYRIKPVKISVIRALPTSPQQCRSPNVHEDDDTNKLDTTASQDEISLSDEISGFTNRKLPDPKPSGKPTGAPNKVRRPPVARNEHESPCARFKIRFPPPLRFGTAEDCRMRVLSLGVHRPTPIHPKQFQVPTAATDQSSSETTVKKPNYTPKAARFINFYI